MRSKSQFDSHRSFFGGITTAALVGLLGACGSERGGIGAPADTSTGSDTAQGTGGASGATVGTDVGGSAGAAGTDSAGAGGAATTGSSGAGGSGDGGTTPDDGGTLAACVFHTPSMDGVSAYYALDGGGSGDADAVDATAPNDAGPPASDGGASDGGASDGGAREGGSGGSRADAGDAGPAPSITTQISPFVGAYLADSTGRSLYTYGADYPGDCNDQPISNCEADCLIAWPLFDASPRTLASSLNDGAFGQILRADGKTQTTYYGWPLYYYKSDTAPGQLLGQAKSRTWHAATVIPMGLMIMKGTTIMRYLADGAGMTLYTFDQDTKGTTTDDPKSACTGSCLVDHPSFWKNRLSVVSSLEPTDFSTFSPSHGKEQLAYKGAPLYYSAADARSGDVKGAAPGWSVALP